MEEKKIKQKDMCRTVDCDKLAVTIFDAFNQEAYTTTHTNTPVYAACH